MSVANVLEVVKLEDLVDIRVSNVDKKRLPNEPTVKLCNYMDVYANDYIRAHNDFMIASASIAEIEKFKVEVGDVLITKDSETPFDIGIPSIVTDSIEGLVCGYHLALLKPDKSLIDSVYLAKQLGSNNTIAYYLKSASGSTRYGQ
jgi:type I restriction enzyme S subunit